MQQKMVILIVRPTGRPLGLKYFHENGCFWDSWTLCRKKMVIWNVRPTGRPLGLKYASKTALWENGCSWGDLDINAFLQK